MPFKAGAIYGEASLDTRKWDSSLKGLHSTVSRTMKIVGVAFVTGMGIAIKQANDFQKEMSNVATLTDEATMSMSNMALQLLTMNPALGDATELASGLYQAISAGAVTAETALQTTTDAAMFARAALTDTNTAVDVLTTAVNAYGAETITTTEASDLFFETIRLGKITGEELAATIGTSIPLYAAAGIEIEELTAGLATMTKQGVNSARATTQLNAIVNSFLKPSEKLVGLLEEQGYASGAALLRTEGLTGALNLLIEESQGEADVLAELVPNIRALRGVMALSGEGAEIFTETLAAMEDVSGATATAFEKQEKTFATLKNSLANATVIVGNIAKTFTDELAEAAIDATQGVIAFLVSTEGMNLVSNIVGYAAGAWGALKEVLRPIVETIVPVLKDAWTDLRAELGWTKGGTDELSTASTILAKVTEGVISTIIVFGKVLEIPIRNIGTMVETLTLTGNLLGAVFTGKFRQAAQAAKDLGTNFKENLEWNLTNVPQILSDALTEASNQISTFDERVQDTAVNIDVAFNTAYENMSDYVAENYEAMVTGQLDLEGALVSSAQAITNALNTENETQTEDTEETADKEVQIQMTKAQRMRIVRLNRLLEIERERQLELRGAEEWDQLYEDQFMSSQTALDNLHETLEANRIKEWKENWKTRVEIVRESYDLIRATYEDGSKAVFDVLKEFTAMETSFINAHYSKLLSDLKYRFENELITEEFYNGEKEKLETEKQKELDKIQRKAFIADKANRIASVISSGASSIMGWWEKAPMLGPIAGPIFAGVMTGIVGAAAVAQIAAIAQQQYVPRFERGGQVINERGGELVNLPDGSIVIPNDISQQIANNIMPPMNVSVSFAGANISDNVQLERIVEVVSQKLGKQMRLALT